MQQNTPDACPEWCVTQHPDTVDPEFHVHRSTIEKVGGELEIVLVRYDGETHTVIQIGSDRVELDDTAATVLQVKLLWHKALKDGTTAELFKAVA